MNLLAEGVAVSCVPTDGGKWHLVGETPDGKRLDRFRLKTAAFGWHARSFYGAAVEEGDAGLLLTPLQALDFLSGSCSLAHIAFRFDERTEPFRTAARLITEVLAAGMFVPMPDASGRRPVRWAMRPTGTVAEAFERLAVSRPAQEVRLWDEWFSEAVWELIETDARVGGAWRRLCEEAPLLARLGEPDGKTAAGAGSPPGSPVAADGADVRTADGAGERASASDGAEAADAASPRFYEDEWLAAIGWRKDEAPFRPALQLVEPEAPDDGWTLRIVLQDKSDPSRVAALEGAGLSPGRFDPPPEWGWPPDWRRLAKAKAEPFARGCAEYLAARGRTDAAEGWPVVLDEAEAWAFLTEDSLKLAQYGYTVLLPLWWEEARKAQLRLRAQVRSAPGSGLRYFTMDRVLAFDWKLAVGDVEWSEAEFLRLVEENRRLIRHGGRWVALDPATVSAIVQQMRRFAKQRGMTLREAFALYFGGGEEIAVAAAGGAGDSTAPVDTAASAVVGSEADLLRKLRLEIELDDMLAGMVAGLEAAQSVPRVGKPAGFCGELRDYQLDGVSWLLFLRRFGLGGCLADDMGLGKTVQWIAYLLHVRENEPDAGPSLLVCPTSVVGNWQKELERFAPTLRVHVHHGPRRPKGETFAAAAANADVVLTTYALVHLDRDELASVDWDSVCLDEAQNIKNAYTKQSEAARSLQARHRVALTGTPMENRPAELWALFDFLNPGYLGSLREFERTFGRAAQSAAEPASSEEAEAAREALERLQKLVRPFLLRRTKKDPAIRLSLPDKFETKTYVALTAEQAVLYEAIVRDMLEAAEQATGMARRGAILAALTRLKQVCNHPATVRGWEAQAAEATETARAGAFRDRAEAEAFAERSNKLVRLAELVREARAEGDKCLIFTQYVDMGRLLQAVLPHLIGEEVPFLHGGVPKAERDRLVAAFQSGERGSPGVFVLSLRAGGTGLNLTAASQVFHYDRWWNPAVEEQASDRAYRIGQTKDVQVHRLIALGTIEERIDEMMERKTDLVRSVVGGGEQWVTELSVAELRELFALRRRWADEG